VARVSGCVNMLAGEIYGDGVSSAKILGLSRSDFFFFA